MIRSLILLLTLTALAGAAVEPFTPDWPSLEKQEVPAWYRDAKFGIFVHWGPQTLAGGDAANKITGAKLKSWKDYATALRGEKFDAVHLAQAFRAAGAKYVVQVAEHHDGFALYDSSLTEWSSVKVGPKRDFVAELSAAARREGLVWGGSSHTEESWWFYSDPPRPIPPAPEGGVARGPQPDAAFLDNWYARLLELVDKYQPQIMWFDWSIEQPAFEPYLKRFAAHYYNSGVAWGRGVVLNYKYDAFPPQAAVRDISWNTSRLAGQPERISPTPWQFDTMNNRHFWFWRPAQEMRPVPELLAEMADVVSKNGNYLLNMTPDPDGALTPGDEEILAGLGRWFAVNGEAIYGTRPWKVYGEGPTAGFGPHYNGNPLKAPWTAQDLRYTSKGNTLYAIALGAAAEGMLKLVSLGASANLLDHEIKTVSLLGSDAPIRWQRGPEGLTVELPHAVTPVPMQVLKIELL